MRRVLMLGLLMVQGGAGACSPPSITPEYNQAKIALEQARKTSQKACAGSNIECDVYNAPAEKVAAWIKTYNYLYNPPVLKDNIWIFEEHAYDGRKTIVKSSGSGTIVKVIDVETAFEKLKKHYSKIDLAKAKPLSCTTLGLNDPAYTLGDCWLTKNGKIRVRITSAKDKSLPSGVYEHSFGPCGFASLHTVNDEFEKSSGDKEWRRLTEALKELSY